MPPLIFNGSPESAGFPQTFTKSVSGSGPFKIEMIGYMRGCPTVIQRDLALLKFLR
jgi:hypothetical protein